MKPEDKVARARWAAIVLARLSGYAGALLGLLLVARAELMPPKLLGIAVILASMLMIAVVPLALARRWRTPR